MRRLREQKGCADAQAPRKRARRNAHTATHGRSAPAAACKRVTSARRGARRGAPVAAGAAAACGGRVALCHAARKLSIAREAQGEA
jgi:hypothetical protein